jgi:signal transduction histidine kinase
VLAGLAVLILYPAPHNITIGVTVSLVSVLFYVAQNFLIPTARTLGPLDLIVSGYLLPVFFIQIRVDNQLIFGRISSSEYFWISSPTPGSYLALSVTDTGPRHGPDVVAQIFGPYFTTKKSGHGPGLSRVQGITSFHNAALEQTRSQGSVHNPVFQENVG